MATRDELYAALRNADVSGDNEGAARLAQYIQGMPADGAQSPAPVAAPTLAQKNPGEYDPSSPEYQAKYGPTSGMSGTQKFMAGAGKSVVDLGRGIQQIGAEAGNKLGVVSDATAQGLRAQQDQTQAMDAPLMNTGAGVAGNIGGALATTLLPLSVAARSAQILRLGRTANLGRALANPGTYRAAAASGSLIGALQPVGTKESRTKNAAIGAATGLVGQAAGNAIGRIAQPIRRALTPADHNAIDVLLNAGVPLDAAQRTGSRTAQMLKRSVADNPITGGGHADFIEAQHEAFTRAVLRTIGEDSHAATSDVMGAARNRIGNVFDDIATRNPVDYDAALHHDIAELATQAHRELPPDAYAVIANQIEDVFTKAQQGGGMIDGRAYQNLRSSLGRVEQSPGALGHWAGELRDTIDDALRRSVGPDDLAALRQARTQYRRMKQIEGAIDKEGAGTISPSKLANSLGTKSNRNSSVYGRGDTDLVRLAQAGKRLLPDKFPNSGTAARLLGQGILAGAVGAGTGYGTGDASKGIGAGLGAAGLLLGVRGAMNNQLAAQYLSQGLAPGVLRNTLTLPRRLGLAPAAAAALPALQE